MNKEFISIIIPTYNRKESLISCIDSINNQNYPKKAFELIIVNDNSTDGTLEYLNEHIKSIPFPISIINTKHSGPGLARNIGVAKAKGTIIAFTEDDMRMDSNWLTIGSDCFINNEIAAVEGITKYVDTNKPVRRLEKQYQLSFLPGNLMIRKNVFDKLDGYDADFYDEKMGIYFREDVELGFRLLESGYKAIISAEMLAYHPRQYQTIEGAYTHAKRYYFDPLLCRDHNELFRKMIEVKRIGIFTIKRPLHYLSLVSIFSLMFSIFFNTNFIFLFLFLNIGFCFKYDIKSIYGYLKILALPLYYLLYFTKGCFKFRYFRAII